ncbi:MAG TPA: hypothetical protein VF466_02305 [Candidatus Saccharimonadales bacterium]
MPARRSKPYSALELVTAAYYMDQPAPPENWFFGAAACRGATRAEQPDEAEGTAKVRNLARAFIAKYCGNCPVRRDCIVEAINWSSEPRDCARGGYMPMEASRLWMATVSIRNHKEGLAGVAAKSEVSLEGVEPYIPFVTPAPEATAEPLPTAPPDQAAVVAPKAIAADHVLAA